MADQKYKVLITTSGIGQRLGELTKFTNPSLVRLLKKPILSHIVEAYAADTEFVVTLGYFGEHVKEFLSLAYPERKFTFVDVDRYEGAGASLVYSMLQAKTHLQCPFIFQAGDSVVMEKAPMPVEENWVGGFRGAASANYRSFTELDDKLLAFRDRGALDFDYLHIGLIGIHDYQVFWRVAEELYEQDYNNSSLGDVPVLSEMIKLGAVFRPREFKSWLDLGNLEALYRARRTLGDFLVNLDKTNSQTFIFDENFVIKFMADEQTVADTVERAGYLQNLTPNIEGKTKHFFRYKFVPGKLYSRSVTPRDFLEFLEWSQHNLWHPSKEASEEDFKQVCMDFYRRKTEIRLKNFYDITGIHDEAAVINGEDIPALQEVLGKIDWEKLSDGLQRKFHGDFILDNIIKTQETYVLLDWRQNFGKLKKSGDLYYDLAKLNHNLTINHDVVFNEWFSVKIRGKVVFCDIMRSENLITCQRLLWNFVEKQGLDLNKIKILTALSWLNSAPLHHHPYNYFLYYFGRLNLWQTIN